eukprot:g16817.t1
MTVSSPGCSRLMEIRTRLDEIANEHCKARWNKGPLPDLSQLPNLLKEVDGMYDTLELHDRAKADMIVGCGWHMLGDNEMALEPLMRVVASTGLPVSDQLCAIQVAMPILQKKHRWGHIFLLQADPGIRVLFLGTLFATKCVAWSGLVLAAAAARPRYLPFLYGGAGGRVLTRFEHHFPKATLRIQALSARAASSRSAQLLARATGADPADLAPAAAEVTVAFRFVWPLWWLSGAYRGCRTHRE